MTPMNPKPAIQLQQNDPHYLATRLHFQVRRSRAAAPPGPLPCRLTPLAGGGWGGRPRWSALAGPVCLPFGTSSSVPQASTLTESPPERAACARRDVGARHAVTRDPRRAGPRPCGRAWRRATATR